MREFQTPASQRMNSLESCVGRCCCAIGVPLLPCDGLRARAPSV